MVNIDIVGTLRSRQTCPDRRPTNKGARDAPKGKQPIALALTIASLIGCGGGSNGGDSAGSVTASDMARIPLGGPLARLTASESKAFQDGQASFATVEDPDEGLGPVFNGRSCGECHAAAALGGAGKDITISRVTRIGGHVKGVYSNLESIGGPVLQARSLREIFADYPIGPEIVPRGVQYVSHRITTPLFGAGLMEAIDKKTLIANSQRAQPDGIHGEPNWITNIETGKKEIGRFGWKAQLSSLHVFAGDAYLNEMGVTSHDFPTENLPQGKAIPPGADPVVDPEDGGDDIDAFAAFMRFMAPPAPIDMNRFAVGRRVFDDLKCSACHLPEMTTGVNASAALSRQRVQLYSDLLVHHMGNGLADGIEQGSAKGDQFRTAPLWGLSKRVFYLHDGRATRIEDAILEHGGEATNALNRFTRLNRNDRNNLLSFLNAL
jgi:CxxC motif-containing protein (DUF1111 family)